MQAPIGPAATVELVAAVCAAGGLGSLAASWTPVDDLRRQVRALAGRRFCVNLVLAFPVSGLGVPTIAAGGIVEEVTALAAREAGAGAVAAGTAFLVAEEADRHSGYVERLLAAEETTLTDVFSVGWPDAKHRVLRNAAVAENVPAPDAMPTGTRGGDADLMALYAGTGVGSVRGVEPAAAIVDRLRLRP